MDIFNNVTELMGLVYTVLPFPHYVGSLILFFLFVLRCFYAGTPVLIRNFIIAMFYPVIQQFINDRKERNPHQVFDDELAETKKND